MNFHQLRIDAQISQEELGEALGRSGMWVSLLERGKIRIPAKMEATVALAIRRLGEFNRAVTDNKKKLYADLYLPDRRAYFEAEYR